MADLRLDTLSGRMGARIAVSPSVTRAPRGTNSLVGGWSLRSDVGKPRSWHRCLKAQKPLVIVAAGSAQ